MSHSHKEDDLSPNGGQGPEEQRGSQRPGGGSPPGTTAGTQSASTSEIEMEGGSPRYPQVGQGPNLPCLDLVEGCREVYLKFGLPLYHALTKCVWRDARDIFDKQDYARYSITENGETPLHLAASAKVHPFDVEYFVKRLVNDFLETKDLELQNKNYDTALYLAVVAGNIEIVKILVNKNKRLLKIPGGGGEMMPLSAAALFGKYDIVQYIFEESKELRDEDGWSHESRSRLLENCVENNMFDVALAISRSYPEINTCSLLGVLARKPEAFHEKMYSNNMVKINDIAVRLIKSVLVCIGLRRNAPEKESSALQLLKFIWDGVVKKPTKEIDMILKGPPDTRQQHSKTHYVWVNQAMKLQRVIYEHASKMNVETENIMRGSPNSTYQILQLQNIISQHLASMQVEIQKIIICQPDMIKQTNNQALESQTLIIEHIVHMQEETHKIIKSIQMEDHAQQLSKHIEQMYDETIKIIRGHAEDTYSSRVLFVAAEMGNTRFLVELICKYPDVVWKVNDNNQSIFHIAVKHRHVDIYNLLKGIGAMKDMITSLRDSEDNNMLHLVGKIPKKNLNDNPWGVVLHMQRELLWFKEIKNMIPVSLIEQKNENGLTPHDLFFKGHTDLATQGEKWIKLASNQCMVVAALIATIVFAATFTIPGGYNQQNGIPIFHSKETFIIFVMADAISLILSSFSLVMFLNITTSRCAQYDFLERLPLNFTRGLESLLLSLASMMVAFEFNFILLYSNKVWIPILICWLAIYPVLLLYLQVGFYWMTVIFPRDDSRDMFKPKEHALYYENPIF